MSEPFIGELRTFGFNFAPVNWALCNGQLMSIAQNTALFSLLGTTYGGDGVSTFALPNLQSRVAIHMGQGQGLSNYTIGQLGGVETVTLTQQQMPQHTHTFQASTTKATTQVPAAQSMIAHSDDTSAKASTPAIFIPAASSTNAVNLAGLAPAGGSQPFSIIQPYLTLNVCIALQGIFPSRN
jgi:microcystin-dependent protein